MSNNYVKDFIDEVKGALNKGGSGSGGGAQPDMNAAPGEPGHILNRTHWKEEVPAIFDGDLTGREVIPFAEGMSLFKMSDFVLSQDELIGRTITEVIEVEDGVYEDVKTVLSVEENISDFTSEGTPIVIASGESVVLSVLEDTSFEGIPLTKGIYYGFVEVGGKVLGYTKSLSGLTTIRYEKIPDEYIVTKPTQLVKIVKQEDDTYSVDVTSSKLDYWVKNGYSVIAEYSFVTDAGFNKVYVPLSHYNYGNELIPSGVFAEFYGVSKMDVNGCKFIWIIISNATSDNVMDLHVVVREYEQQWLDT